MKEIKFKMIYTYTCRICQQFIEFEEEPINKFIICSNKCKWKHIYQTLNTHQNKNLTIMFKHSYPNEPLPKKRNDLLLKLTKHFAQEVHK